MKLRSATPADAEAVALVYTQSRTAYVAFAPLAHSEQEVREWVRQELIPSGGVTVLEEDGAVRGMIAVSLRDGAGWIDQLYVVPGYTGRGFGSALLRLAKKQLPHPIRLYTFQENTGSRRFYERHGFEPERFSDGSDNEERCPDLIYRLDEEEANKPVRQLGPLHGPSV